MRSPFEPPPEVMAFLGRYPSYYIVGHKEPDGDCVGSQLALQSWLKRRGKEVLGLSAGPFTRTEIAAYEGRFLPKAPTPVKADAGLVIVDCSSASRVGDAAEGLEGLPSLVIDHHAAGDGHGELRFVVSTAPAVTCLVQAVIEADGGEPSADEAELLLFGLCTDTGFFRHLDERGAEAFAQASRLIRAGASPKRAFAMMSGGKPLASRKLLGELLLRAEAYYEGRLLISYMTLDDHARYGLVGRDSDMLYQLLMTVEGVEAAAVIRQEKPGECTVGFRSKERIDVAAVAAGFGGGGHRLAAGLHLAGELADVKALVIASFSEPMRTLDGLSNQS